MPQYAYEVSLTLKESLVYGLVKNQTIGGRFTHDFMISTFSDKVLSKALRGLVDGEMGDGTFQSLSDYEYARASSGLMQDSHTISFTMNLNTDFLSWARLKAEGASLAAKAVSNDPTGWLEGKIKSKINEKAQGYGLNCTNVAVKSSDMGGVALAAGVAAVGYAGYAFYKWMNKKPEANETAREDQTESTEALW